MANGVLVFGEVTEEGKLNPVTGELIAAGTRLGGPVTCLLAGSGVEGLAQDCVAAGANKVIVVDDAILAEYQGDAYLPVAERVVKESGAGIVLLGQTMVGRDLAPRLAQRLGTAVAMDCVALSTNGDKLIAERPAYGGSARARYSINGTPQMATVRPKSQEPLEADASRSGEIVKQAAGIDAGAIRAKTVSRRKEKAEGIRLEDAKVVVGGGRGLGGPEAFQQME
ncbi:MAG TPA: electron transfer flavoprotein subunit alpha, partial [Dehalococcoidia bacterium]|nr:electron transfer flavoprotein subunit alpha [Dehalococcoidia bacterium]